MRKYKVVEHEILPDYFKLDGIETEDCAIFVKKHWWSKWKPYEPTGAIPPFKMRTKKKAMQIIQIMNAKNYCGI